jgi:hypothetical protein
LFIAACSAVAFTVYGAIELLFSGGKHADYARVLGSFACFGVLAGGVLAYDTWPGMDTKERPVLRTLFGAMAGLLLALIWSWSSEGVALSVIAASILGYAGSTWARHL